MVITCGDMVQTHLPRWIGETADHEVIFDPISLQRNADIDAPQLLFFGAMRLHTIGPGIARDILSRRFVHREPDEAVAPTAARSANSGRVRQSNAAGYDAPSAYLSNDLWVGYPTSLAVTCCASALVSQCRNAATGFAVQRSARA